MFKIILWTDRQLEYEKFMYLWLLRMDWWFLVKAIMLILGI